jgi:hypothetical protein
MHMVDNAKSESLARMGKEETIWAAEGCCEPGWRSTGFRRRSIPTGKACNKRKATPAEQMRGEVPVTQFGRMCQKLGIRIIAASSRQAKGRVERIHGVHQDRLIKKLRRKKIDSYEAANQYLEKEDLPEHNRRFAQAAAPPQNYHGRKPTTRELREIFRLETERAIANDWVVRHEGRYLQLQPGQRRYGPTQSKALVCEWQDGAIEVYYRGERIAFTGLKEPIRKTDGPIPPAASAVVVRKAKQDRP